MRRRALKGKPAFTKVGPMAADSDIAPLNRPNPFQERLEGLVGRKVTPAELEEARRRTRELARILEGISRRIPKGWNPALGRRVKKDAEPQRRARGRRDLR